MPRLRPIDAPAAPARPEAADLAATPDLEVEAPAPMEAAATPKKPRAPRPRKKKAAAASEETPPPSPPPPPPTECVDCHASLTWRDAFYVPERGRRRCKRCFARLERERVEQGQLVKPAPNKGRNRAERRAAGLLNNAERGHYRMQLDLAPARPKTQSSGRRAHKRHHVPCLCCWRPTTAEQSKREKRGAA